MDILSKRKNVRLRGYDYSQNGCYFVTICTQNRQQLFGEITPVALSVSPESMPTIENSIVLNDAGKMVNRIYNEMFCEFPEFISIEHIIMPNHIHCIISIEQLDKKVPKIGDFICSFKSKTTVSYINGVKSNIYPPFEKRIWQRSYHDIIIRDEVQYKKIRNYIINNPKNWQDDRYYE